jgi:hypothetical protein
MSALRFSETAVHGLCVSEASGVVPAKRVLLRVSPFVIARRYT